MADTAAAQEPQEYRPESGAAAASARSGIEWIRDVERFDAVRGSWEALAGRDRFPFLRHAWFAAWWRAFGGGVELAVCVLWDHGELAAAFPLARRGGTLESLAHPHHAPVFRPLARDAGALAAVIDAAIRERPAELVVHSLPQDDPAVAEVVRRAGSPTALLPQHVSPLVDLDGDFAGYRASLSRSKRKELERLRRRLEEEHEVRVEIAPPTDLEAALGAISRPRSARCSSSRNADGRGRGGRPSRRSRAWPPSTRRWHAASMPTAGSSSRSFSPTPAWSRSTSACSTTGGSGR